MTEPRNSIEPYDQGMLDVGNDNTIYWETCGNPLGKTVVMVHGGPGSGCTLSMRNSFDVHQFRIVLFDQRGCGRSTPHASDPTTSMAHNTTEHLLGDMEKLRDHLAIDRWLLCGGSWGSTLILAYAERFPQRVTEILISSVTTGRRSEFDWLYRGVARFFPDAWEQFRDAVGDVGDNVLAAYARRMESSDPIELRRVARAWCTWEDTVLSLEPGAKANFYSDRSPDAMVAFVRICANFAANGAWLDEGVLLREAHRLTGIPAVLIHGRLDLSSPLDTAWDLSRAWPNAELLIANDSGHQGTETKRELVREALARFSPR